MNVTKATLITALCTLLLTVGTPDIARSQPRWVVINGVAQNPMQLSVLDRLACMLIPNGSYWLDYNTGIWGYSGDPRPMGRVGDGCTQSPSPGRPSLSERGMLYSSQPWGRGR